MIVWRIFFKKFSSWNKPVTLALTVLVIIKLICVHRFLLSLVHRKQININSKIKCHRSRQEDALSPLNESNMAPNTKFMFFHETSCRGRLNSRQSCAIESAAKMNSDWTVNVLFCGPLSNITLKSANIAKLMTMHNVKFQRIHVDEYAKGTPLESLFPQNLLSKSKFPIEHTADILRLLSLYKYSGLYIDMDVVVVKPFNSLPKNFMAKESSLYIASGILAWSKVGIGRNISELTLRELETNFNPNKWAYNGPALVQRVLKKICSTSKVNQMNNNICKGLYIFDAKYFYPIPPSNNLTVLHSKYFSEGKNDSLLQLGGEYMHHVWNAITKKISVAKNSLYAKLAAKFCPAIYNLYGDYFGV